MSLDSPAMAHVKQIMNNESIQDVAIFESIIKEAKGLEMWEADVLRERWKNTEQLMGEELQVSLPSSSSRRNNHIGMRNRQHHSSR